MITWNLTNLTYYVFPFPRIQNDMFSFYLFTFCNSQLWSGLCSQLLSHCAQDNNLPENPETRTIKAIQICLTALKLTAGVWNSARRIEATFDVVSNHNLCVEHTTNAWVWCWDYVYLVPLTLPDGATAFCPYSGGVGQYTKTVLSSASRRRHLKIDFLGGKQMHMVDTLINVVLGMYSTIAFMFCFFLYTKSILIILYTLFDYILLPLTSGHLYWSS